MDMVTFEWMQTVFAASALGIARNVGILVLIIVPLMIVIEFLREYRVIDWVARVCEPFCRLLGLSREAAVPLMSGIVFGINYGAGLMLDAAREGRLTARDSRLLCIFLVASHAVFEDTLLFVPYGVNPFVLLGARMALAVVLTMAAARWMERRERTLALPG